MRWRDRAVQPLSAGVLLLLVYAGLAILPSPGGYLGTDTGAKVATLEVMKQHGTARPFLGYWAEAYDPAGTLHPIYDALPVDGDWVHVTTLPMLELARPLYALGGYRLTLLLPMLGAVGVAFAARSLGRRSAGDRAGWYAYWAVGLVSPIVIYALDLWEHAPGVACIVGAVALLAGIVDGEPVSLRALGAGALLGLAATMRNEAFVYALVAVSLCGLASMVQRRSLRRPLSIGALAVIGFSGPWLGNQILEATLGGNSRASRVSGTAAGGFGHLNDRAREAATTLLALRPDGLGDTLLVGGALALLLVMAVLVSRRGSGSAPVVFLALAFVLHLSALAGGFGFVPGMIAAAPLAVVGLLVRPGTTGVRYAVAVAVGALPIVWAFQFIGGALPQWAGRYALPSCILLVAVGAAALAAESTQLRLGMLALSALVTTSGVLWLRERSHEMQRLFAELVHRPEEVIVVRNGFFIREGGAAYSQRLWLTAVTDSDLDRAVEVVEKSNHTTFAVLDEQVDAPLDLDGARLIGTDRLRVVGVALYLHSYDLRTPQ